MCTLFYSSTRLSRAIHCGIQLLEIYKSDGKYYSTVFDHPKEVVRMSVVDEIRKLLQSDPEVASKLQEAKPKPRIFTKTAGKPTSLEKVVDAPKKVGSLRRSLGTGAIAYALYRFRDDGWLTFDELMELTGVAFSTLYASLIRLRDKGYVERCVGKDLKYKWSGNFTYPFNTLLDGDAKLLRFHPAEWANIKRMRSLTLSSGSTKPKRTVEVIDTEIESLNLRLEALQEEKKALRQDCNEIE